MIKFRGPPVATWRSAVGVETKRRQSRTSVTGNADAASPRLVAQDCVYEVSNTLQPSFGTDVQTPGRSCPQRLCFFHTDALPDAPPEQPWGGHGPRGPSDLWPSRTACLLSSRYEELVRVTVRPPCCAHVLVAPREVVQGRILSPYRPCCLSGICVVLLLSTW